MAVRLIVTGGTFDKEYDEIGGRLYFKTTHVSSSGAVTQKRTRS